MGIRVLIVDDQAPFRNAAGVALSLLDGFELVGEAETGEDSVEMAQRLHPDLILMDVNLPGMDGVEATRRIKEQAESVVVLLLSTYSAEDYGPRVAESGASAFIPKSEFGPERLAQAWAAARAS
jgi:DNA-binding NarL/FixJ family response regulator